MSKVLKIPVVLVTGFLGSGKTTFLRHLAASHPDWRLIFLVNEFSETDVDGDTLAATGTPTQSVIGGSLFCECKAGDFLRIMREKVLTAHQVCPLDAVVIETSGTADPSAIGALMASHGLGQYFEIRRLVTVVAPARFRTLIENLPVVRSQLQTSDCVIINKTDTVNAETLEAVKSIIRTHTPNADLIEAYQCQIDFTLPPKRPLLPCAALSTCEANPFDTVECTWPAELGIDRARHWLTGLPETVLRIKGRIKTPEGHWMVERTVDGLEVQATDSKARPELVFIAHENDLPTLKNIAASLASLHPCQQ